MTVAGHCICSAEPRITKISPFMCKHLLPYPTPFICLVSKYRFPICSFFIWQSAWFPFYSSQCSHSWHQQKGTWEEEVGKASPGPARRVHQEGLYTALGVLSPSARHKDLQRGALGTSLPLPVLPTSQVMRLPVSFKFTEHVLSRFFHDKAIAEWVKLYFWLQPFSATLSVMEDGEVEGGGGLELTTSPALQEIPKFFTS